MNATETISPPAETGGTIYNRIFWLAYLANFALVTANALTFRFAEFVKFLGGTEKITGAIISLGIVGALVVRLFLGQAIDRYGTGKLWCLASLLFLSGCLGFVLSRDLAWLYAARIAFTAGLAAMFTCSMVFIQNQVPPHRKTEIIGTLGSSGFVGMITGTQVGDAIFRAIPSGNTRFVVLFGCAAALAVVYLGIILYLIRGDSHCRPDETPAAHRLLFRYWPGTVVLGALMMGIGFTVSSVFLTRFATHLGLGGIGTFFTAYCISAFVFRILGSRWSRVIGRHRMILMGLAGHCLGLCLLPYVRQEWHFIVPAMVNGFGHALLFPAVVSLGAGRFPIEYRGTGTTLVLGFTELGAMLSAPPLGWIIDRFGFSPMFYTAAGTALTIGVIYGLTAARHPDEEAVSGHPSSIIEDEVAQPPEIQGQKSGAACQGAMLSRTTPNDK